MAAPIFQVKATHQGSIQFRGETHFFADNELGSGSKVELKASVGDEPVQTMKVRITWRDWNWFDYVAV